MELGSWQFGSMKGTRQKAELIVKHFTRFCDLGFTDLRSVYLLWVYLHEGVPTNCHRLSKELHKTRQGVDMLMPKMSDLVQREDVPQAGGAAKMMRLYLTDKGRSYVKRMLDDDCVEVVVDAAHQMDLL